MSDDPRVAIGCIAYAVIAALAILGVLYLLEKLA